MDMRVDAARNDDLPGGVDHPPRAQRGEAAGCAGRVYALAADADIGGARSPTESVDWLPLAHLRFGCGWALLSHNLWARQSA